jgi:membrane-associated phospholipid phosphatase
VSAALLLFAMVAGGASPQASANPLSRHGLPGVDVRAQHAVQAHRTPAGNAVARVFRYYGQAQVYVTIVVLLLGTGRVLRRRALTRAGYRLAGTLLLAGLIANTGKVLLGRERPSRSEAPDVFRIWSDRGSFPSGHTAVAFALSGSLAAELANPVAGTALYLVAAGTGWSRMNDNSHWLTDVVAGALTGILCVLIVQSRWPRRDRLPTPDEESGEAADPQRLRRL